MKNTKFRAWDGENLFMSPDIIEGLQHLSSWFEAHSIVRNDKEGIITQYIGLKDKNGVEIYEGDIVKSETDKPMLVTWNKRFASFCLTRNGWAFSHWFGEAVEAENVEVIGNMFQNAELINEAELTAP